MLVDLLDSCQIVNNLTNFFDILLCAGDPRSVCPSLSWIDVNFDQAHLRILTNRSSNHIHQTAAQLAHLIVSKHVFYLDMHLFN